MVSFPIGSPHSKQATFDRLHRNVRGLGIACHDLAIAVDLYLHARGPKSIRSARAMWFSARASIPFLFLLDDPHLGGGDFGGTLLFTRMVGLWARSSD